MAAPDQKVCPLMTAGWLANQYASLVVVGSYSSENSSFVHSNLCPCCEDRCAFWDNMRKRCGILRLADSMWTGPTQGKRE